MKVKWKFPIKFSFFCDENITKKLQEIIKKFGYPVESIRNQKLFGMNNGDLAKYLNANDFTLITFDKDFLEAEFSVNQGIIVLDINPNRDEFTVPLLEEFLILLKNEKIDCNGKKILLNRDFFLKFK
jgi:predicted nuclease of predicted toxin-antitoxin system